jgi:hypothetical protein
MDAIAKENSMLKALLRMLKLRTEIDKIQKCSTDMSSLSSLVYSGSSPMCIAPGVVCPVGTNYCYKESMGPLYCSTSSTDCASFNEQYTNIIFNLLKALQNGDLELVNELSKKFSALTNMPHC